MCDPETLKLPPPLALTVPRVVMPSPQAIVAEKSLAVPLMLASVKFATAPLKAVPSVAVTVMPAPDRPASPMFTVLDTLAELPPSSKMPTWTVLLPSSA